MSDLTSIFTPSSRLLFSIFLRLIFFQDRSIKTPLKLNMLYLFRRYYELAIDIVRPQMGITAVFIIVVMLVSSVASVKQQTWRRGTLHRLGDMKGRM